MGGKENHPRFAHFGPNTRHESASRPIALETQKDRRHETTCVQKLVLAGLVWFAGAAWPPSAAADSLIRISGEGRITFGGDGSAVLVQTGTASHLGQYVCYSEISFRVD